MDNDSANFVAAQRGRTLRRGKTLNRPERFNAPEPMLKGKDKRSQLDIWVIFSKIVTFWAPGFILKKCGFHDENVIQAWREKVALCFIITCICAFVVFITLFMSSVICPSSEQDSNRNVYSTKQNTPGYYVVNGYVFSGQNADFESNPPVTSNSKLIKDVSLYFNRPQPKECTVAGVNSQVLNFDFCTIPNACQKDITLLPETNLINTTKQAGYDWDYLPSEYFVLNGVVIDMTPYLSAQKDPIPNDELDSAIREAVTKGKDATRTFLRKENLDKSMECIRKKYYAGVLTKKTVGCFGVDLFQNVALVVVLGIVLIRFVMAAAFHWFLSHKLSKTPKRYAGKSISVNDTPFNIDKNKAKKISNNANELFTVLLVTCYSEGEDSMKTTLDSLANTEYSDDKKLLFVIADGIITGSGNDKSTPEIITDLIDIDPVFHNPEPQSYIAVADGSKQHNMAKVYCGHYCVNDHRVPILAVIKCGTPPEREKPKPGNRGKRDSQLILMGFFSRVIYNDRMTPLDYDLFIKTQHLMGITPDYFETVLMVDADTKVYPSSLRLLTNCLLNDTMVMGLCGETKIANKKDSLVTTIQVFEYYISHHLGKGFESVFGGVTCLPGCFCMYRLKAPKGTNDWVPIITKPEIIQEYSQNIVETLHQKNLLLLGEDRFLTTLMLRNFPNRKMMFVPQAICKTVVPDEFSVLLSQRRRWINSTIHNLLELVLVRNLCGTFCFSMQFVIFMELIGTVALPVAIIMTYYLIISLFFVSNIHNSIIPLLLLLVVLFSPAILILITTRKLIYVAWMFVYLIFLFVWNFILPVYSYWHFDDFSWGATRMVEGEVKGDSHGKKEGQFNAQDVSLKRWDEYERQRIRKTKKHPSNAKSFKNDTKTEYKNDKDSENKPNNQLSYYEQNEFNDVYATESEETQQPQKNRKSKLMGPRPLN